MAEADYQSLQITNALEQLRSRLNKLFDEAENISKRQLDFVMAENKKRAWAEKSILYLKARTRDNTLTVTWNEVHWYGSKAADTRRMKRTAIIKPKEKYCYSMSILLKRAQHWEEDMVREIEEELTTIRREAYFIGKAIGHLNHIIKRDSK